MSGGKLTDHQKVLGLSTNFKNRRTPFTTNSAAISLQELEEFIDEAKVKCPGFSGLRIYLVRYPLDAQKSRTGQKPDRIRWKQLISAILCSGTD